MKNAFIAAAALAPAVLAQQSVWGQCGGINWTGPTTCVAGSTCTYSNDWYSQCLPGGPATTTTTARTSSRTTTTSPRSSTTTARTTSPGTTTRTTTGGVVTTTTRVSTTTTRAATTTSGGGVVVSGNPYSGVQPFANPYYASEILTLAVPSLAASLRPAASAVAKVPTFAWLDTRSKVPLMDTNLAAIRAANQAGANPPIAGQFVVYDLPERDCAAAASNGEFSLANNGLANYREYIDAIKALVVKYSDIKIILVIEPDSLANLVTNMSVAKCANAKDAYLTSTNYAIKSLALPNVSMYLDGGHGGWLGWPANLDPAVTMFAQVFKDAGSPPQLRGLVTNVANYNAWTIATCPSYTSPNPNCDEKRYVDAMQPKLAAAGWDAYFLVDTGRNGVQPTAQIQQGNWCNVIGTGFGVRPTTNTGHAKVDSFVWVKPGGESDGTSDTSAVRYDFHCGSADALKPAPEAGTWFQAYFEQLLRNANPAF